MSCRGITSRRLFDFVGPGSEAVEGINASDIEVDTSEDTKDAVVDIEPVFSLV